MRRLAEYIDPGTMYTLYQPEGAAFLVLLKSKKGNTNWSRRLMNKTDALATLLAYSLPEDFAKRVQEFFG